VDFCGDLLYFMLVGGRAAGAVVTVQTRRLDAEFL
jgi:hypothetical protein